MTSNIGSGWILDPDLTEVDMNHRVMETVRATEHIRRIVEIQLGQLRERLAERDIGLELSEKALDYLSHQGYDPAYGARPLKRLIQKELQDRIALALLRGDVCDGGAVRVEAEGVGLRVGKARVAAG